MDSPPSSAHPRPFQPLPAGAVTLVALALAAVVPFAVHSPASTPESASPTPPVSFAPATGAAARTPTPVGPLPQLLSQTGFGDASNLAYSPQYPLWSDGASKRRFVSIPRGESIDAQDPDDWQFPSGTRFWKEFSFGERVETRYLEKLPDGSFRFASYAWDPALGDSMLVPEGGLRNAHDLGQGVAHDIPSRSDCLACHEGRRSLVLGFNALQLSPERDPLAVHGEPLPPAAVDLRELIERGLLRNFPSELLQPAPRIAATSPTARAAQGYLFGNCSGCHNARGPLAALGLDFDQPVRGERRALSSSVSVPSNFHIPGAAGSLRVAPGRPQKSVAWFRMNVRGGAQMPPLGTKLVDHAGTDLIARFIARDVSPSLSNQKKAE
jgi:mono/diheme cytochrome c family protein